MKMELWSQTSNIFRSKLSIVQITLLGLCFLIDNIESHVLVYRRLTSQLIEEYNDLPAQFGASLPQNGLKVFAIPVQPTDYACDEVAPPPKRDSFTYPINAKFVALIKRGGVDCTFEKKVRNAQSADFDAVIMYNNDGDDLEQMSAKNSSGIHIPSVFVGQTTGESLKAFFTSEIVLVINDEMPFNINTQLILPFSILIGLCFLVMIFYMIYKCIREERRLRRHRLPKGMLKQLPILKFTKNNDLSHDTCAICLEDFVEGDKLRVLPCKHPYHSQCIDPWLTENRRVCPICKRKVFTKRGARLSRSNRQSSLDSVTDTDDDTTPLLQPSNNANARAVAAGVGSTAAAGAAGTAAATTTRSHGTFGRGHVTVGATTTTSDDENVLLTHQSPMHNARRMNPFDRTPNLPPHLAEELSEHPRSIWTLPIFRIFRRHQPISVAAPPYLEEVVQHDPSMSTVSSSASFHSIDDAAAIAAAGSTTPAPTTRRGTAITSTATHSSNNIMNPNLSGSFKDDDDDEMLTHQSIYEPIAVVTPVYPTTPVATATAAMEDNNGVQGSRNIVTHPEHDPDSVFIQTPSQGGIGVVALPNRNHNDGARTIATANPTSRRNFFI